MPQLTIESHNIFYILVILLGFSSCIGPIGTFFKDRGKIAYTYLAILSLITGPLWAFATTSFLAVENYSVANIWIKTIYLLSIAIGVLHFLFSSTYIGNRKAKLFTKLLVYLGAIFLSYTVLFTNQFVESIHLEGNNYATIGNAYYIWILWLVYIFSSNTLYILRQYKELTHIEKEQQKYLLVGSILTTVGSFPANIIAPIWGIYEYIWLGPVIFSISNIIISYGLTQTKFIRISKTIRGLLRFIGIYLLPSTLLIVSIYIVLTQFSSTYMWILILICILIGIITFKLVDLIGHKLFLSEDSLMQNSVKDFANQITNKTDLQNICNTTLNYLIRNTPAESCLIFIYDESNKTRHSFSPTNWEINNLARVLRNIPSYWPHLQGEMKPLIRAELEYLRNKDPLKFRQVEGLLEIMNLSSIQIAYPVIAGNNIIGLFLIKDLSSKEIFRSSDLYLIHQIYSHSHMGINRALLYEQLQTFNNTLQSKVNEQTKELQIKVKELEEARRKEADMIDIMGHELRTPATIVKLNASFLTKFVNEIDSNPEGYKKYVNRIQEAIENEIKLINTLLSSAKLEGDKIELNPEEIDIQKEIDMSLHGHETLAQGKNLKVINQTALNTPNIYADKARLVEVLNNLISNAIKYTEKGGIMVKTTFNDQYVKVSVVDTGNGIPKQDLPKLGQKFYRISNYINKGDQSKEIVRPGGTGLGLYVTFNLVRKMGGDIWVESEVGKGSIFSFTIPRYNNQRPSTTADNSTNMFERLGLKK